MNEELIIRITKSKYNGNFSHWEVDVESDSVNIGLGGTAPTIWGVLDMASEYLWEHGQKDGWFKDNANDRN